MMNRQRRLIAIGLMVILFGAAGPLSAQDQQKDQKIEQPGLLAVLFYADWCNSCKILEPKLNQVKREFQDKSVLFTRFDLTDDFTKDQSAHFAALIGLENFYRESEGKTGFMLLIDGQSKKLLGKITKEKSPDEIRTMLTHALKGHSTND
ncbi:MAG: thioredoxin family protein [Acidobacteriota bacterium]